MNIIYLTLSILVLTACGSKDEDSSNGALAVIDPGASNPTGAEPLPEGLLEHVIEQGVPRAAARFAFDRYESWRPKIRNGKFVSIIDFTKHSGEPRLFVVDVNTGTVDAIHVAHAKNSDANNDGLATSFGNVPNSKKSSLGSYVFGEKYYGKYGASLKLDGLENSNSLARARSIVMHPSNYVSPSRSKQGRSWGCPAVPYAWISSLIERLRDGTFMYVYSDVPQSNAMDQAEIRGILFNPFYQWINESEDAPIDGE